MIGLIAELWSDPVEQTRMRMLIKGKLEQHFGEAWHDKEHCLNCGSLMRAYSFTLSPAVASTLRKLGDAVRNEMQKGKTFTEANKLYISGMDELTATECDRKTILKYHGLLAKVKDDGKQKDAEWAITTWGWAFLRGEPVAKSVKVWRGLIQSRSEETVTIGEILKDQSDWNNEPFNFEIQQGQLI